MERREHSPLPWYFVDEPRYEIYAHDKGLVCNFDVSPYMEDHEVETCRADAELIIQAVNQHATLTEQRDLLVAALCALLECSRCTNGCAPDDMTCATNLADNALATVEQGEGRESRE